ncbi:methionine ABC transporter ATP-binding protein [Levyella massiliensis]|uniref:methionine ABC transporter ATP-binding protein n=1 Tax=Levyella massiliensis TaxID=938289 RepID=UPI00037CFBF1|nr:methionine ABC transporter ATP-binding protein [Levyella massiliensis]
MIKAEHLTKEFPAEHGVLHAVRDVSFAVEEGEIFGIIGLSGAGKSTLVRLLNRLEEPTSGKVIIDDVDITNLKEKELLKARKEIGMIFQSFNLFNQKTIRKNIAYPLEIAGWEKSKIQERTEELLHFIGLAERGNAYPSELSGGQKQRVAIARAMALQPKILLSDEGTSALDPKNTASVLELLRDLAQTYKTTIIMITHQMEVAKEICDRIAVMAAGEIVETGSTNDIFFHPKHPVTKSFISKLQDADEFGFLQDREFAGDVVKLTYRNEEIQDSLIAEVLKKVPVGISILSANIDTFRQGEIGYVVVELTGSEEERKRALQAFQEQVEVEVLK